MDTFSNDKYAFLILDGYVMGLVKHVDNFIHVVDSHARNYCGKLDENGTSAS